MRCSSPTAPVGTTGSSPRRRRPLPTRSPRLQDARAPRFELKRVVASDVLVAYRDGKSAPQALTIETPRPAQQRQRQRGRPGARRRQAALEGRGPGRARRHPARGQGGLAVRPATRQRRRHGLGQGHRGHRRACRNRRRRRVGRARERGGAGAARRRCCAGADAARPCARASSTRGGSCVPIRSHVSVAGQTVDGRMTVNTAQSRPRVDATLTSKSIDLTKLAPRVDEQAPASRRAAARRPGRDSSDTPLLFAAVPAVDLNVDLKTESLRLPETPPLSAGARPALVDPGSGRARRRRVRQSPAGGSAAGRTSCSPRRAAAPRCGLRCEVALGRGARCRDGRRRPLPGRPRSISPRTWR